MIHHFEENESVIAGGDVLVWAYHEGGRRVREDEGLGRGVVERDALCACRARQAELGYEASLPAEKTDAQLLGPAQQRPRSISGGESLRFIMESLSVLLKC